MFGISFLIVIEVIEVIDSGQRPHCPNSVDVHVDNVRSSNKVSLALLSS